MFKLKSIVKSNLFYCLLTIFLLSSVFTVFFIYQKYGDFTDKADNLERSYMRYKQDLLSNEVENTLKYIAYEASLVDDRYKDADKKLRDGAIRKAGQEVLEKLRKIKFGKNREGNILIIDFDGTALLYPSKANLEGRNIRDLKSLKDNQSIKPYELIIDAGKKPFGDVIHYTVINPSQKQYQEMIAFSKAFKPWGWTVSSEMSRDSFLRAFSENRIRMKIDLVIEIAFICVLFAIITIAAFIFIYSFSRAIKKELDMLIDYLGKPVQENPSLSENDFHYSEFKFIAASTINMVSRIRELLQKLKELAIRSEINSQAKSSFLAGLNYEIRSPLNGIMGMSNILLESKLDKEQRNCVESILTSGKSLVSLINAISDFSSLQAGNLEIRKESFDLKSVCSELAEIMSDKASAKKLELKLNYDGNNIPPLLSGDPKRIKQIMINLIDNALSYTQEGTVYINVKCIGTKEKNLKVSFEIQGTSLNISGGFDRILEDLTAENTLSQKTGVSFSLAVCKYLVELMGGEIGIKTEESNSAQTIFFNMPFQIPETVAEKETVAAVPEKSAERSEIRVLLVEDDPINQRVEANFLSRLNCKVTTANNGIDGLKKFKGSDFDMIFMDCQMPEMDGYAATRAIRASDSPNKNIPVIALTADAMRTDIAMSKECGMNDHIAKPISVEDIKEMIAKYL